jgi:O-antigen ligase
LIVQLEWPLLGLSVLVAMAVAFPVEFRAPGLGVSMSSSFPLAALMTGVWLFRVTLFHRAPLDPSRVVYAAVAVILIALLAFAVGQFPWFPWSGAPLPAQIAELGLFVLSALLFLAVGHQIESLSQLKWLTSLFIGMGFIALVVQAVPSLRASVGPMTTAPATVGSLFYTWLVAVTFSQSLFNRNLAPPVRLFLLGITVLVMFHGLYSARSWASGWVPPLAAIGVILLFKFPRFSIAGALIAIPLASFFGSALAGDLLAEESYSIMTREQAWATLWRFVERSPLFGTGPANYYYYTENVPLLGWYVSFIAHNNYQDILVQTGFVGLLVFVWFAFEVILTALRLQRQVPTGFPRAYVVGALGGLAGSLIAGMLGDWIIPFYYNAGILGFRSSLLFWVFLGGLLAVKRMAAASVEDAAVVGPTPASMTQHYHRPLPVN